MKASDLLSSPSKWVKGLALMGERMCLGAAINLAYISKLGMSDQVRQVIKLLYPERVLGCECDTIIPIFNDHPDTTFEDIQRVMKVADV